MDKLVAELRHLETTAFSNNLSRLGGAAADRIEELQAEVANLATSFDEATEINDELRNENDTLVSKG